VVRTGSFDARELIIGFAFAIIYCAVAYFFLYRSYRAVLRRGTFARFATE